MAPAPEKPSELSTGQFNVILMIDAATLQLVFDSSSQLSNQALSVGGAAVALIVGTAYHRPKCVRARTPFLLFLPGWWFIAKSLLAGSALSGSFLAFHMVKRPQQLEKIASNINDFYADQHQFLIAGVCYFAAWLSMYVVIWVFTDQIGAPS